ncbi:MAG: hypothetical protein E4H14_15095 [Candidatus Thorarchaeota archaeon]|nr:MAG: hypothetical protein E4H14_15095 [Candidatus Thorarchaeota archaeon]
MRNKKKQKTIDDLSVSQLLDDFIKVDVLVSSRPPKEIEDEDYIRMMLKKDVLKKLERTKRETHTHGHSEVSSSQSDTIDDNILQRFFPDVSEITKERELPQIEKKKPPEKKEMSPEDGIVEEILSSIVVKDVSGLASRMKEAVDFIKDEMGTSDAERQLAEALEEYGKTTKNTRKRIDPLAYNDNILVLKRCQNCYFCVGEKNRNDSLWCLCTNPDRSLNVEVEDSWVKSELNLPCWKGLQK